jgi:hypothetical protein
MFQDVSAWLVALALSCALVPATARAQQPEELPARVGRVADFAGQVYLAPADRTGEWVPIDLNYPIAAGDSLWISGEGRAEVDFGGGQFRLAGDTNVHVSRLDEREFSLFVAQGRVIVRIRVLDAGEEARVDTPNSQVLLAHPGLYRIDVAADGQETTVVVREGEAVAGLGNGTQQIFPGQTATLFGVGDVQADVRNGTGLDGFDAWSATRDRRYAGNRSTAYVSPQMVGYADLDQYGSWQTYPDYGAVWFPTSVGVGWAPYRYGRWTWLPAWGWTWVDDAPWGYAPFHYGRWAWVGGRWGWCPGTYVRRPVWAPALVAWYGGGGWGAAAGARGPVYGWVPLGWREPYLPAWRNCGARCWTAYNRPYAVNVAERPRQPPTRYVNHRVPGGITAMAGTALASGKPVAPNIVHVSGNLVATAPIMPGVPQLKPMPVTANVVRAGNGVPLPASTTASRTRRIPFPPRSPEAAAGGGQGSVPVGRRPAYGTAPAPAPVAAVPPGANRSAPVYNAAEIPARPGRPVGQTRLAPALNAVPPSVNSVSSAPPGHFRSQPASAPRALSVPQTKPAPLTRSDVSGRPLPPSTPARPQGYTLPPQAAPAGPMPPAAPQGGLASRSMAPRQGPQPTALPQAQPAVRAEKPAAKPGTPLQADR